MAFDFVHWYGFLIEAEQSLLFLSNKASVSLFLDESCHLWWKILAKTPFGKFLLPLLFTDAIYLVRDSS
jgi:hypothetical protein